jgi:hypothetical protein
VANNNKRRNYTLAMLAVFGFTGLLLNGLADTGRKVPLVICSWEWVSPKPLEMCRPKVSPKTERAPGAKNPA